MWMCAPILVNLKTTSCSQAKPGLDSFHLCYSISLNLAKLSHNRGNKSDVYEQAFRGFKTKMNKGKTSSRGVNNYGKYWGDPLLISFIRNLQLQFKIILSWLFLTRCTPYFMPPCTPEVTNDLHLQSTSLWWDGAFHGKKGNCLHLTNNHTYLLTLE